jgi:CRISPR/Cas system type I-B associated protein Csh2 (Cas7 group RAMP superfamily)
MTTTTDGSVYGAVIDTSFKKPIRRELANRYTEVLTQTTKAATA